MSRTSSCPRTECPEHGACDKCRDVGRAPLSPAAEVTWFRTEGDPGEYLIIEAEGRTVRLTQKEVAILADVFKSDPDYYRDPFAEIDYCNPEETEKEYTDGEPEWL